MSETLSAEGLVQRLRDDYGKGYVYTSSDLVVVTDTIEALQAEVTTLRTALEDVQAIHDEYDGKPDFIPVAGWSAIRERLQHADVREALHGRE